MLTGADAAVGFVIAAKTIARFRLLDDRDFAEYYLLGTLGSVSVAIFTGLLHERHWASDRRLGTGSHFSTNNKSPPTTSPNHH